MRARSIATSLRSICATSAEANGRSRPGRARFTDQSRPGRNRAGKRRISDRSAAGLAAGRWPGPSGLEPSGPRLNPPERHDSAGGNDGHGAPRICRAAHTGNDGGGGRRNAAAAAQHTALPAAAVERERPSGPAAGLVAEVAAPAAHTRRAAPKRRQQTTVELSSSARVSPWCERHHTVITCT